MVRASVSKEDSDVEWSVSAFQKRALGDSVSKEGYDVEEEECSHVEKRVFSCRATQLRFGARRVHDAALRVFVPNADSGTASCRLEFRV